MPEMRKVKVGLGYLETEMTQKQAQAYGEKNMPRDLKAAGFKTSVFVSDAEINGSLFFCINYGK